MNISLEFVMFLTGILGGKMGIGLSEYRASIGAFAGIAASAGLRWRSRSRRRTNSRTKAVDKSDVRETAISLKFEKQSRRGVSLDERNFDDSERSSTQRSKSWNRRTQGRWDKGAQGDEKYHHFSLRTRSHSKNPRQKNTEEESNKIFKNSQLLDYLFIFLIKPTHFSIHD